jgi:hypothetical protein
VGFLVWLQGSLHGLCAPQCSSDHLASPACPNCRDHRCRELSVRAMRAPCELHIWMREIAHTRVRYGYRKIRVLLTARAGRSARTWSTGAEQGKEGLGLRKRSTGRLRIVVHRQERLPPTGPNQVWAMDLWPINSAMEGVSVRS